MSIECKIIFNNGDKKQMLKEINVALVNSSRFTDIDYNELSLSIKNEDPNSKWDDLANLEIIEEGFFFSSVLNRVDRNFIIDGVQRVLGRHNIVSEVEEI